MKFLFKSLILFLLIICTTSVYAQFDNEEYRLNLLKEARKFQEQFNACQSMKYKYNLLFNAKDYMKLASDNSTEDPLNNIVKSYSYLEAARTFEEFLSPKNQFEQYKYLVVALRLYTEYYELTKEPDLAKHLALLHKTQQQEHLKPYIHFGFYKNDIFNFSVATPSFDYFENLSLSCFQVEVQNNSTNEVDFSRFKLSIKTLDGEIHEELDLEKNKEFHESLPPMPDGYIFDVIPIRGSDRALKLFPTITDETQIEKFILEDSLSDFKIEALFFENMKH